MANPFRTPYLRRLISGLYRLSNLGDPIDDQDAATKAYVDSAAGGGVPAAHATSHQNGGTDEISVAGLSGLLADPQAPLSHTHPESDITGLLSDLSAIAALLPSSGEKAALAGTDGTPGSGNKYVTDSDPRLSGGATRDTASITTASTANNANATGTIALAKSSLVYKITASELCRVRLYGTSGGRTADLARATGVFPDWNVGLLVELLLDDGGVLAFQMQPPAIVENQDGSVSDDIYYAITNLSGITTTIDLDVEFLALET